MRYSAFITIISFLVQANLTHDWEFEKDCQCAYCANEPEYLDPQLILASAKEEQKELIEEPNKIDTVKEELVLKSTTITDVPEVRIRGAEQTIPIGDIVHLWVEGNEQWLAEIENLSSISYAWTVLPEKNKIIKWPDSTQIIFGTGKEPKTYTAILTTTFAFLKENEVTQKSVTSIVPINVGTDVPQNPNIPQNPDDGSLSGRVEGWLRQIEPTPAYSNVQLQQDATKIASNFKNVINEINKSLTKDENGNDRVPLSTQEIIAMTKEKNAAVLANEASNNAWAQFFEKHLNTELTALVSSNQLNTSQDFLKVWSEIYAGFEKYL